MNALVARRQVAAGSGNSGELRTGRGDEFDFGADSVAIALVANEFEDEPMILRGSFVVQNVSGAVVGGDDHVDAAVIVDITGGKPAA